uniref:Beta-carotene isomerase D27-like C-terminal domain-containing protein n=1 Tax=Amphora coffeiformis TaxID=265554 RepID=A0A7S3P4L4_9STRA
MKVSSLLWIGTCAPRMVAAFLSRPREMARIPSLMATPSTGSNIEIDWAKLGDKIIAEAKEAASCISLASGALFQSSATAQEVVETCDTLDALSINQDLVVTGKTLEMRRRALEFKRYELLAKIMRDDYDAYVATASFLSPSRIPRMQLPNVQDVPYDKEREPKDAGVDQEGVPLVADCGLESVDFKGNILDKTLLSIFRKLVAQNTGGVTSEKAGIQGLCEQGRTFMLQPNQTPEAQHKMVYDTLGDLMTPVLPPFYRIFMSGIVPKLGTSIDGKQLGPWFYAPFLTSFVTPTFFAFLVGPSRPNRRKDGQLGGLVVEKCQFLQESGCKGLCLHQCKLPAQQFFDQELGLPLTVSPNFDTQECQWSFGEVPLPAAEDPSFPKGCLVGCESRKAVAGTFADLCN